MTRNIERTGRGSVSCFDRQNGNASGDLRAGSNLFTVVANLLLPTVYVALTLVGAAGLACGVSGDQRAQDRCSLEGTVRLASQQGKALPVPGVLVKLTGVVPGSKVLSTTTDSDGQYRFDQLTAGTYAIEATLEGFEPFHETVTLRSAEAEVEDITLQLDKVVQKVDVQDKATAVSTQEVPSTASINSREFTSLPLAEEKFKEALPIVPGVVRTHEGKLNIKGSPENQGMLLVDSVQTVDPVTGSFSIPVPVDVIETMDVYKTPYSSEYGGFSGGLTAIQTKPPSGRWDVGVMDFIPGVCGKAGHIVGIAMEAPRLFFDGPIIKNKLNFAEAVTYDVVKSPVYGLAWPHNETKQQGFDTYTSFQVLFSAKHILSFDVNGFSQRRQFANIRALVPQSASADDGQRGVSLGANDKFQFDSGAVLSAVVRYTRFDSNSHGQGPDDMLISPEGWSGNFFNRWTRTANHLEAVPLYQFSPKTYLGQHDLKVGVDLIHSSFDGTTLSHPIQLLRQDDSLAEQIDFQGGSPLQAQDTEVSEFVQDHWMFNSRAAVDLGARLTT
jgi:outer membrane receptor for ferrienterochelin and colicin